MKSSTPTRTLNDQLADYFRARPGVWIDGRDLSLIAGCYAWRSRVADVRRPPFNLVIENRQRRVRADGRTFVVSEYRALPPGQQELFR